MLLNPLIWWACMASGLLFMIAGLAAALRRSPLSHRRRPLLGIIAVLLGLGLITTLHAYGPWWRHAPTWLLIRLFPTHAPTAEMPGDPVAAELRKRIDDWAMAKRDRIRLAALCGRAIRDPAFPWQMGAKAAEIMIWMKEEKYPHTGDILAGLEREDLRAVLLSEMARISNMGPRVRAAMAGIVADPEETAPNRCRAAWVLAVVGPAAADAAPALLAALGGPDAEAPAPSVARCAAHALARIGPDAARHGAAEALDDASEDAALAFATRYTARIAAACVRRTAAGEAHAHAAMLRSDDARVRRRAALGLRWLVDIREAGAAVTELVAALGDPDDTVARLARDTLVALIVIDERYGQMLGDLAAAADPAGAERIRDVLARVRSALPPR